MLTPPRPHLPDHEGDAAQSEAGDSRLDPEPHHPPRGRPDPRIAHVEVGLVLVEPVGVVGAGLPVIGPRRLLYPWKHHPLVPSFRTLLRPDVPVTIRRVLRLPRPLKPFVLIG